MILLESWTSTAYFSNSTGSSATSSQFSLLIAPNFQEAFPQNWDPCEPHCQQALDQPVQVSKNIFRYN